MGAGLKMFTNADSLNYNFIYNLSINANNNRRVGGAKISTTFLSQC